KDWKKAVELLQAELKKNPKERRLRLQLADAHASLGQPAEAVKVLGRLADDLAAEKQSAQAIAVLKKIQALQPARTDIERKVARLLEARSAAAPAAAASAVAKATAPGKPAPAKPAPAVARSPLF